MKKHVLLFVALASLCGLFLLVSIYTFQDRLSISPDLKQGWRKAVLPHDIRAYQPLPESQWNTVAISAARDIIRRVDKEETVEVQQVLLAPDGKSTLYIFREKKAMTPTYFFRVANSNNMFLEKCVIPDA